MYLYSISITEHRKITKRGERELSIIFGLIRLYTLLSLYFLVYALKNTLTLLVEVASSG